MHIQYSDVEERILRGVCFRQLANLPAVVVAINLIAVSFNKIGRLEKG